MRDLYGVGADDDKINIEFAMTYAYDKVDSIVVVSVGGCAVLFVHAVAIKLCVNEVV